ncbi:MocR-like pyridoxine biosynthesis transcription factor PdxR [Kordiimonas aquimaris]|uniref:MocR-like pyridoxine biosynthesis transcription factor PdxR n=1 Tax=Kordiimonas aquimaris TaxID=707591 RepID=UPI0021D3A772|nr:PLP-dependent aminotransferase family protein [Kordiimonas aquimaris]
MEQDIATLWSHALENSKGISLQKKLHADIRGGILDGILKTGARLPATRALAKRLGIARNTVIEAYDQLIAEGYLETKRGAGTFVSAMRPDDFMTSSQGENTKPPRVVTAKTEPMQLSGMPALDQFPNQIWARAASKAVRGLNADLMYHRDPLGYAPLRQNIADYLKASRTVVCSYKQVMIVSGLQQGLFLLASSVLQENANIILEEPGFIGMLAAARATGIPISYTAVDADGACVPQKSAGLLVTSPSQQYPLGYTMPHNRRLALLNWARETDSLILEDDYDSEFRYAGRPLNSLQGVDGGKRVIYGGTFSKSLFPAVRMGYLVLPEHLVNRVMAFRSATDSFPAITGQLALNAFMESGEFSKHIRRLRKVHARRQNVCAACIRQKLSPYFNLQPSDAGLHLLLRPTTALIKSGITEDIWVEAAYTAGIGAVSLSHTFNKTKPEHGVLMGFANMVDELIEPAIETFRKNMQRETGY